MSRDAGSNGDRRPLHGRIVERGRRWLFFVLLVNMAGAGLATGVLVALVTAVAGKLLLPAAPDLTIFVTGAFGALVAASVVWARSPRIDRALAARLIDSSEGSEDALLTAVEMAPGRYFGSSAFADIVARRADAVASRAKVPAISQPVVGRNLVVAGFGLAAVFAVLTYVPYLDWLGRGALAAIVEARRSAVKAEIKQLDEIRKSLVDESGKNDRPTTQAASAAAAIEALKKSLEDPGANADPREALARMSTAADRIEERRREAAEQGKVGVGREGDASAGGDAGRRRAESQVAALERALRRGNMEMARSEIDRLAGLATGTGRAEADNRALGRDLSALAGRISGQQALSGALGSMGDSAQNNNERGVRQAADAAKNALEAVERAQADARRLERALDRLQASRETLAEAASASEHGASGSGRQTASAERAASNNQAGASGGGDSQQGNDTGAGSRGSNGNEGTGQTGAQGQSGQGSSQGGGNSETGASSQNPSNPSGSGSQGEGSGSQTQGNPSASGQSGQGAQNGQSAGEAGASGQPGESGGQERPSSGGGQNTSDGSRSGASGANGQFEIGDSSAGQNGGQSGQNSDGRSSSSGESGAQTGGQSGTGAGSPSDSSEAGGESNGVQPGEGQNGNGGQSGGAAQASAGGSAGASALGGNSLGSAAGRQARATGGGNTSGGSAGSGSPGSGWGVGTTNLDAGRGPVPTGPAKAENRQATGRVSTWTEEFIRLYDPKANETRGRNERASSRMGAGEFTGAVEVRGGPRTEAAKVEATRAFLDWRETNRAAQQAESVPRGYRDMVKGYFDSIEPPKAP